MDECSMCGGPLQEDGTCPSCDGGTKEEGADGEEKSEEEGSDDAEKKDGDEKLDSGEDW